MPSSVGLTVGDRIVISGGRTTDEGLRTGLLCPILLPSAAAVSLVVCRIIILDQDQVATTAAVRTTTSRNQWEKSNFRTNVCSSWLARSQGVDGGCGGECGALCAQ